MTIPGSASAVAYIRKSVVNSDRHLSWEIQEQEIRALALRHGDAEVDVLADWGRSGRAEKTHLRAGYAELRQRIDAGTVSVVYAYSLSRLARSLVEYSSLAQLCRDHGVRIRLCKEGEFDYATPMGRTLVGILALLAQMEAELAQERTRDMITARRARGDYVGGVPYGYRVERGVLVRRPDEDPAGVIAAFRDAGSYCGAVRLLNDRAPRRRGPWLPQHVKGVLQREAPLDIPGGVTRGAAARSRSDMELYRLLRCTCGTTLTPTRRPTAHRKGAYRGYFCHAGRLHQAHARPYAVSEAKLLPWVRAEASRLRTPDVIATEAGAAEVEARALLERRQRVIDNYEDGLIQKTERDAKLVAIASDLQRVSGAARALRVPTLDWSWPATEINAVLRSIWDYVELDENLLPVRAVWRVPEWRADYPDVPLQAPPDECRYGHLRTPDSTRTNSRGHRLCLACESARAARRRVPDTP